MRSEGIFQGHGDSHDAGPAGYGKGPGFCIRGQQQRPCHVPVCGPCCGHGEARCRTGAFYGICDGHRGGGRPLDGPGALRADLGQKRAEEKLDKLVTQGEIANKIIDVKENETSYEVTVTYEVLEEIGTKEKIVF